MRFTKMHGAGNDYVYVDCTASMIDDVPGVAVRVSDRHFGIGSDGLILIRSSDVADFCMEMYNADGSRAQMCGNGIRCVAKFVYDHRLTDKRRITVETLAGIKTIDLLVDDGENVCVGARVNMGAPELAALKIPTLFSTENVVGQPLDVGGTEYRVTCVSMGNPHCVVFMGQGFDLQGFDLERTGPLFENHEMFPERINTEFIVVRDRSNLDMRVWERGSGETLACGTGACASLVAAVLNGLSEEKATLHLRGGDLEIEWNREENNVYLTGPAVTVFEGDI
jgi:diaminopimelate epimerase